MRPGGTPAARRAGKEAERLDRLTRKEGKQALELFAAVGLE